MLLRALLVVLLVHSTVGFAQQPVRYAVRIEAPEALRTLLAERLPLARWQDDPEMTESLLLRLVAEAEADAREAAATRGYFSARVATRVDRSTDPWTVVLELEPGPQTQVARADLRYSGPATTDPQAPPLLQRIRREWKLPPGARFSQDAWDGAKREAVRALAAWRYAGARIAESRARVDPQAARAELDVTIDSGPAFRYGPVEVRGARRYPDSMIAALSPTEPGAFYDRETLDLYERRLLETGYFVSAQSSIASEPAEAAPVRVAVIEGRSQHFETGLSFSTDVGPRVEARYRNLDVFDTAYRFGAEAQLDKRIRQGRVELDGPPRAGGRWNSVFAQARDTEIQNEQNTELSAGLAHNWGLGGPRSSLFASVHAEEQRLGGELADHRHAVFFGYRTQWRNTDRWEAPRRGTLAEISVGGAPEMLASRQFARGTARAMLLVPVGRHDFVLRGEAGLVIADARDGIPSSFLFRTGGDQTVRGYPFESLGVEATAADGTSVVVGGRYLAVAGAEYTHWIGENWGVAAFADLGDAWDNAKQFDPALGTGFGARLRTPVGPVRADLAYGHRIKSWRLHFSVGFVF